MMDVTVNQTPIGTARVVVDLGDGHELVITASHETDSYRRVRATWRVPAHVTGPREQVRDRRRVTLVEAKLALREGKLDDPKVRHPILRSMGGGR